MASVALYGCDDSGDNGGAPVVMTFAVLAAMRQLFQERDLEVIAVCPWLTWGCRRLGARLALVVRAVVNRRLESVSQ